MVVSDARVPANTTRALPRVETIARAHIWTSRPPEQDTSHFGQAGHQSRTPATAEKYMRTDGVMANGSVTLIPVAKVLKLVV